MVAKEVEGRLVANHVSLPATSSPWVQGTVQTATNPLPGLSARHSMKSLLADVPVRGYQGQERSGGDVQASSSLDHSIDKWSRPPKDVPWWIKRSRPGVGGDLTTSRPGSPSGRDQGRDRCMVIEQHPHPQTLGEGQAVDQQGILTEDLVKPTQPERGATHAKGRDAYAPPRSTRHKLAQVN
ncbi:hypothetical protein Pcinc_029751 [Petrolisthes cinctipes]|uniref:Uncharacterized protein n=1 Tax=Petrolisthes cinctipes TaxID=88211 RepID=A0AAE1EZP6_PETCI|nr:hypothetical protein Pcinc_029751 [Petrolisthes cinctipes]